VVVLAQDESRALRHNYIGTEHILLGLLREEEGVAARVLESLGVAAEDVRAQVARIVGQGDEITSGQIPFTSNARKVLEGALKEALSLRHARIGAEHILLGLARANEGVAARILLDSDVDADRLRTEVIRVVSDPGYADQAEADLLSENTLRREVTQRGSAPPYRGIEREMLAKTVNELIASLPDPAERAELRMRFETALGTLTVGLLLDAVTLTKETCIERHEFESAARFRDIERKLVKAAIAAPPPETSP